MENPLSNVEITEDGRIMAVPETISTYDSEVEQRNKMQQLEIDIVEKTKNENLEKKKATKGVSAEDTAGVEDSKSEANLQVGDFQEENQVTQPDNVSDYQPDFESDTGEAQEEVLYSTELVHHSDSAKSFSINGAITPIKSDKNVFSALRQKKLQELLELEKWLAENPAVEDEENSKEVIQPEFEEEKSEQVIEPESEEDMVEEVTQPESDEEDEKKSESEEAFQKLLGKENISNEVLYDFVPNDDFDSQPLDELDELDMSPPSTPRLGTRDSRNSPVLFNNRFEDIGYGFYTEID